MNKVKVSKTAFYILSFSWGLLYTLAGMLVALVMLITGHKVKRWGWSWYFETGGGRWGGMSWGPVFIKDRYSGSALKNHEFGHAVQNCFFGPFMIFLVGIPSSIRYWARRINTKHGRRPKSEYESVWFERQATKLGNRHMIINSTLCYIEKNGCYLMLYRNKKPNDPCAGKWVGIGGKFEDGEDADACLLREVREETGLTLKSFKACGVIHFRSDRLLDEEMFLYTSDDYDGELSADAEGHVINSDEVCSEGDLKWIPKEKVTELPLWEGDIYFLEPLINGEDHIEMTCVYEGDRIVEVIDDNTGKKIL